MITGAQVLQFLISIEPAGVAAVKAIIADVEAKRSTEASLEALERHIAAAALRIELGLPPRQ